MNQPLKRNDHKIHSQWILTILFNNGAKRRIGCLNKQDLISKAKIAKINANVAHVWANDFQVK